MTFAKAGSSGVVVETTRTTEPSATYSSSSRSIAVSPALIPSTSVRSGADGALTASEMSSRAGVPGSPRVIRLSSPAITITWSPAPMTVSAGGLMATTPPCTRPMAALSVKERSASK